MGGEVGYKILRYIINAQPWLHKRDVINNVYISMLSRSCFTEVQVKPIIIFLEILITNFPALSVIMKLISVETANDREQEYLLLH